jgi:hypothetical protein
VQVACVVDLRWADFRRDGACVVRGCSNRRSSRGSGTAPEQNLHEPSERAIEGGGDAGSGRFSEDFRNWTRIAPYEEVIRGSRLGEAATQLTGCRTVRLRRGLTREHRSCQTVRYW